MSSSTVSVVIPAHNAAKYLAEAVASVRAQTAPVQEIVVIDDGSTDDTVAVAAGLGPGLVCHRQAKQGAAAARNRGAEQAKGAWLTFLDADDLWRPGKLAAQLAWMQAAPETAVVFGLGSNFSVADDGTRREEPARPAYLPGAALLRRDYFLQQARFDEKLSPNEVIAWNLHLKATGAVVGVVPELVMLRRLHPTNTRRQGDGGRPTDLRLLREWIKRGRQS